MAYFEQLLTAGCGSDCEQFLTAEYGTPHLLALEDHERDH